MPTRGKKWNSGNPGGIGGNYHATMMLCRDYSPDAAQRLIEVAELDAANRNEDGSLRPLSNHADRRLVSVAASQIIERAWGRPRDFDPASEKPAEPEFNPRDYSADQLNVIEQLLNILVIHQDNTPAPKLPCPRSDRIFTVICPEAAALEPPAICRREP